MIMPGPEGDSIRATGGQVDEMTMALIDAAHDRDEETKSVIGNALFELGKKKPHLVLSTCHFYLKKHNKLSQDHRIVILNCIERIVKETLDRIDSRLAVDLIQQASQELTQTKEVDPEWQTAASGILVEIGKRYCDEVMGELLQKFQPGVLPHFFVVQTMGNLASSNVFAMVPHLTAVLGTMLPMLGLAKYDNMRWVFATALAKFSEAIVEYVANLDTAPDKSVSKERFSGEIMSAFDLLFNNWLQSKEAKLRLAIVQAVGHMTHVIEKDKLAEQLPKILQGIIGLYKRHPEPFQITQGLCMVLAAVCEKGSTILEPHLDNVLNVLFTQIFLPVDSNSAESVKNHNEVLRSFAIIAQAFSGKLVSVLLTRLEPANDKTRIGILAIFRHIMNSADEAMADKKEVVVSGLKMICSETNNKVKKMFAQVVITMATRGYLELEGGHVMVEFIVRQCALPDDPPSQGKKIADPDYPTNQELRSMCDSILQLITTTISVMESVLWPYLLELVVPEQYTIATGAVCRSLAYLAQKKREENAEDYEINFDVQANLPRPPQIIARLMVLCGWPQNGRNRGMHVLQLMKNLSPNLHENLVEIWDTVVPKLIGYLEENEDGWSQKNWEDLLLKLLSKSLEVVDNENWTAELGEAFGAQIGYYANCPQEKNFLFKCLGIILRKSSKKDFVVKHLDIIFASVRHTDQLEREGCAIAVGFAAASHLDFVLTKLEAVAKSDMVRKSSGILGILKDKSEGDIERVKATIMLCYGYVALYSPPALIISRMEATILRTISPYFTNVRDTSVKQNLIRTVSLIGEALHPDHLETYYNFSSRGDFITHLQNYLRAEPTSHVNNDTRSLAMDACTTLVKLDPQLSEAEMFDLVKCSTDCVYSLPVDGLLPKKNRDETYEEAAEVENLMKETMESLHTLLKQFLVKNPTSACLFDLFKHLQTWIASSQEHERERAVTTWFILLEYFTEVMEASKQDQFLIAGQFLGTIIPRCTDPSPKVRQIAVDCVQLTLRIGLAFQGHPLGEKDQMVDALSTLKERLKKSDPNVLFSVVNDLSKVIAKKTTKEQLYPLVECLLAGLTDAQSHSSSGACVVLNGLIKLRGSEVYVKVGELLKSLHAKLLEIQCPQTKTGTLRTLRTLASHHMPSFLNFLLQLPVPYSSEVVEIWHILAQDPQLTAAMLEHFLELLQKSLPYEEKTDSSNKTKFVRSATVVPLAVTFALIEVFAVEETAEELQKIYHRLFAACLVRLGSSIGVGPPKSHVMKEESKTKEKKKAVVKEVKISPIQVAIDAMKGFLERAGSKDLLEALNESGVWAMISDEMQYPQAITMLAKYLVSDPEDKRHTSKIVTSLTSVLSSLYENQRVTVAAFFAELINQQCAGDDSLVELIMNSLLGRLVDTSHIVRMLCIRGLGNIASVGKEQVQRYSTTILSAMMAGMDDKEDPEDYITIEAMSGLSRVLSEIDESHIRAILINVALKIRPCFEKDKPAVRAQAFILFGNLSRFGGGPSRTPFLEQIHSNIVSLLLHLNDEDPEVKKSCKFALRLLGPLMSSEAINDKFQKHLLEEANLFYGEFMIDLSKLIIQDFPEKVNFYVMGCVAFFKSSWPDIRSNAAMFVGFLLGNLPKDRQTDITKEHVCASLILLLKDPSPKVRAKAAEAMSLLYDY
ncbi:maestro heat-like repeat-containing protein family member 1 isoform X3 [Pomacea canaliculata]|uniref:maestro heat-like repeat-containing protein family member 1 isoform X3 n=1 Tax=Pomacea canaliculata TaxID=400727 RepID=UPI000D739B85|nr:maestro heat-like repeat-containing protein family member 1 isoform X3 [Pomacea canaliculata]